MTAIGISVTLAVLTLVWMKVQDAWIWHVRCHNDYENRAIRLKVKQRMAGAHPRQAWPFQAPGYEVVGPSFWGWFFTSLVPARAQPKPF